MILEIIFKNFDNGKEQKDEDVDKLLKALIAYAQEMSNYKIGTILSLNESEFQVDFKIEYNRLTKKK